MSALVFQHIADQVGVSPRTVQRTLLGEVRDTRPTFVRRAQRIRKLAGEMNYRPNAAARAVATGRFHTLALLLAQESYYAHLPNGLLFGIEQAASEARHHLAVARLSDRVLTDPAKLPRVLGEHASDGLLINYHFNIPNAMRELIQRFSLPVVWLNSKQPHDAVYPDDRGAGRMGAEYLLQRGFRRIAYADFSHGQAELPRRHYSATDREAGYTDAMRDAGLEPLVIRNPDRSPPRDQRFERALAMLRSEDRPEAVVTYSPSTSEPLCIAGVKFGLPAGTAKLPVVTFSEDPVDFLGTPLPTLVIPHSELGKRAVRMLLDRLDDPAQGQQPTIAVPYSLTDQPGQDPPQ